MLIYILLALCVFGFLAWFFNANAHKSPIIARAQRLCPCSRLAQTGALSKLLTYAAIGVIMIDGYAATLIGLSARTAAELALCALLLLLGFKVAKE